MLLSLVVLWSLHVSQGASAGVLSVAGSTAGALTRASSLQMQLPPQQTKEGWPEHCPSPMEVADADRRATVSSFDKLHHIPRSLSEACYWRICPCHTPAARVNGDTSGLGIGVAIRISAIVVYAWVAYDYLCVSRSCPYGTLIVSITTGYELKIMVTEQLPVVMSQLQKGSHSGHLRQQI